MNEYVYVAYKPGFFKIGYSTDPHRRVAEMQTYSEQPVELLAVYLGRRREERFLHKLMARHRAHREWFHANDETFDILIEANADEGTRLLQWSLKQEIDQLVGIFQHATNTHDEVACHACGLTDARCNMNLLQDCLDVGLDDNYWAAKIHADKSPIKLVPYCHNCYAAYVEAT